MDSTIVTNMLLLGTPAINEIDVSRLVACGVAGAFVLIGLTRTWEATLRAPLLWGLFTTWLLLCAAGNHTTGGEEMLRRISTYRYFYFVSIFCPLMAVLGAKRPQNRGWQWIVLSLLVVLTIPGIQSLLNDPTARLVLPGIWQGFLWLLIAMGLLNYMPTRHWLAALPFAIGQVCLLSEYLFPSRQSDESIISWGYYLLASAAGIVWLQSLSKRSVQLEEGQHVERLVPQLQRWLRFRDGWGAFWTARLMARVNQTAELQQWPIRLWPSGFKAVDENADVEITEELAASVEKTLDALLWRFERVESNEKASVARFSES